MSQAVSQSAASSDDAPQVFTLLSPCWVLK